MKRPLVWMVILFCLGIVAERSARFPFFLLYSGAAGVLLSACIIRSRRGNFVLASVLVFVLGMTVWRNDWTLPRSHLARLRFIRPDKTYLIRGWVTNEPQVKENQTSCIVSVEEIADKHLKRTCCGKLLVIIRGETTLAYGQELVLEGRLLRPFGEYLRSARIFFVMRLASGSAVKVTAGDKGSWVVKKILGLKRKTETAFNGRLSPIAASVIAAMVLGEQKNVPQVIYRSMMKTGTVHILVVSGFNVGIVCLICMLVLKLLRIPRRIRFFFCVPLLIIYCLLTGSSNPVVRATIMATVFLAAYHVQRDADIYTSCALAALIILAAKPTELFNIGFQLSFTSVLAIAFLYPRIRSLARVEKLKFRPAVLVIESCLVSFSAWIGTAGIIAYNFKMVSPVTVVANLFIVPLATLITVSSVSLTIAEYVSPYLASAFAPANEFLVNLLLQLNTVLLRIPHAYFYLSP